MNAEQWKSSLRTTIISLCATVLGIAVSFKWLPVGSAENIGAFINGPLGAAIIGIIVTGAWGVINKTQANSVAIVDEIAKDKTSEVAGVIMMPTAAGVAQAQALPGNTTVVAGTVAAANLAKAA